MTIPRVFLSAFEEIGHKYPTRFSIFSFKQAVAILNMPNSQYLLRDHSYGITLYLKKNIRRKLKITSQTFSFLKLESKKIIFLLIMSWIISRSKRLTRSNPEIMHRFILLSKVLGDQV